MLPIQWSIFLHYTLSLNCIPLYIKQLISTTWLIFSRGFCWALTLLVNIDLLAKFHSLIPKIPSLCIGQCPTSSAYGPLGSSTMVSQRSSKLYILMQAIWSYEVLTLEDFQWNWLLTLAHVVYLTGVSAANVQTHLCDGDLHDWIIFWRVQVRTALDLDAWYLAPST